MRLFDRSVWRPSACEQRSMIRFVVVWACLWGLVLVLDPMIRPLLEAAETRAFTKEDAVAQWMRNDPAAMMRWCEANLTQKQLDEIQAMAIPPLTEDERLQALRDAKALLERAGATDPAKAADAEIKAIQYQRAKAAERDVTILPGRISVDGAP